MEGHLALKRGAEAPDSQCSHAGDLGWLADTMGHGAPSPISGGGGRDWVQQRNKVMIAEQATDFTVWR